MKRVGILAGLLLAVTTLSPSLVAQEKPVAPPPPREAKKVIPLKVQVVISEYEGTKKLSSLPYTLFVNADDSNGGDVSQIRVGIRVPVLMGANSFQYMDIGTNVDCRAWSAPENRFRLGLSIERSYLYSFPQTDTKPGGTVPESMTVSSRNPVVARLNSSYVLYVRDGQTIEATSTTDPVSGRVLKVEVTVNTVK